MENVLIDDRRIHVDFSQSVAKLWRGYRAGKVSNRWFLHTFDFSNVFRAISPKHTPEKEEMVRTLSGGEEATVGSCESRIRRDEEVEIMDLYLMNQNTADLLDA